MHCDYQLAYCPITYIVSQAFRDRVFENKELTPELFWRLRVRGRGHSLPIRWKKEKLDIPVLRRMDQTAYEYEVHRSMAMTYESSHSGLKDLGEDAGFEDPLGHYNFRR